LQAFGLRLQPLELISRKPFAKEAIPGLLSTDPLLLQPGLQIKAALAQRPEFPDCAAASLTERP
jgi:hypothetical protein